ncbi:YbjQ family protein [Salinimicrobium oceani]|uniref:Heavy metal-binding domain-containing protein n=1 Tax=Salinimicrobium oceani TaxID=2722702 RepID=A0ABX1D2C2_9FLAO|nr:heavy metal-binding domain-containing protein [Salinimicrobium oceani]NJW53819.1 heavy metal-binding domain-containing protein [Salinimicrobium oceani]
MSDIFGGRSGSYKKQLSSIYSEAIERIKQEAKRIGANGVVGLKIDIDEVSGGGKSMFMITAIGTAVIIKASENTQSNLSKENFSNLSDRVDNDQIRFLRQLKVLEEKARDNKLDFTQDVWEFIIQNKVKEFFPTIISKLTTLLTHLDSYTSETVETFKNNTTTFLSNLAPEDQVNVVYNTLKDKDTAGEVEKYLHNLIKEQLLLDFGRNKDLLEDDNLAVRKRGMILSTCDRPYYSEEDVKAYEELCQLINSAFPERGTHSTKKQLLSPKEKEVWVCECGKANNIDITYCSRCHHDIHGFTDGEAKPKDAIALIEHKISLIEEALKTEKIPENSTG